MYHPAIRNQDKPSRKTRQQFCHKRLKIISNDVIIADSEILNLTDFGTGLTLTRTYVTRHSQRPFRHSERSEESHTNIVVKS